MRYVYSATLVAFLTFGFSVTAGHAYGQSLSITNYQAVDNTKLDRTNWNYTFTADLVNKGAALASATATLTTSVPNITVVPGSDMLMFGPVASNGQVTSKNTFTVTVDRSYYFDLNDLHWTFTSTPATNPVANAGANQTVAVGSTVTLIGTGSTNPSGYGKLTYSWAFTSKPVTSNASLLNATTATPSFTVDVPGNYIAQLTVSNGFGTSKASVTISTNNSPPIADAGPNQTVSVGATAKLDGSKSSDVNGNTLTFAWTFKSVPAGSAAVLIGASTVSPTFIVDKAGSYQVQLIVSDVNGASTPAVVTISTSNTPPVANAGTNQMVSIGATVQLDGSGSTDVDGNSLTYKWSLLSIPANSTAALSNSAAVKPTFVADLQGSYVVQLIVNDGFVDSAAVTVTITTNQALPPTANAGANQTVKHNSTVSLSGSGSDPQGYALTYKWSLTTVPSQSTAALSSTTIPNPTFFADKPGTYIAQLIVSDQFNASTPVTVTITTTNTAPVANAGPAQNVFTGLTVTLTGSSSTDADNDVLTYAWSLTTRPAGSAATLNGANTVAPTFVPDVAGTYVAQLIVSDPYSSSTPVTVTITATSTAILLSPNPLNLGTNANGTMTVTVGTAAGSGGLPLTLTTSDSTVAAVPGNVTIAQGQTSATFTVVPGNVGSATITAAASGLTSATATVNVATPAISLAMDFSSVGLTRSINGTITLSSPAPATGTTVALNGNPSGIVTLPQSVTVAAGATTTTFTVVGASVGATTILASAPGYSSGTALVTVSLLGQIKLPVAQTVGPGQTVPYPVSLAALAPFGGVTINLSNSDTTGKIVTLSTNSVFVPFGSTVPATQPTITGVGFGNASITASAGGFTGDTEQVSVTGTLTFQQSNLLVPFNGAANLTLNISSPAPAGLTINLSSDNSSIASVPSTVTFPTNATSVIVPVTGVTKGGPLLIHASALPNLPEVTSTITVVNLGAISISANGNVTQGAATPLTVTIPVSAPAGGVTIMLSSSDSSKATVTASVTIPAGATTPATAPQVTGVAVGSATLTASGLYFSSGTTSVNVLPGVAASITATGGTPQSGPVNTAFPTVFTATVKDAGSNLVSGASVTFTAPSSGASGTFAGGSTTATVSSNSSGIATSPIFTANGTIGSYVVSAAVPGVATTASFNLTNQVGPAASITATSGTPQSAPVNMAYGSPLSATVKDSGGNGVSGVTVTFALPSSGASAAFAGGVNTAVTNSSGVATSAVLTANNSTGAFQVSASVTGVSTPATFSLTNTPGTPTSVTVSSGSGQSVAINTAFASPLVALVKDSTNAPVSGVTVTFAAPGSGASGAFAGGVNTAVTNAAGLATSAVFTSNTVAGAYSVTASVSGVATPATFSMTNTPGPASVITVSSGSPQSAAINQAFGNPLVALVKDSGGNAVPGVVVTFVVPASGAGGTFAGGVNTATTNSSGLATSAVFTANGSAGPYNVAAGVSGVATPANFALTNTQGNPNSVTVASGNPQNATINTAFGAPLAVTVKDIGGNLLSGITVTFTAPGSGASGSFAGGANTAVTNASGVATSAIFTANSTAGTYSVNAAVSGVPTPAVFTLTNNPGAPASVTATAGTPQTAVVANTFSTALAVVVKDIGGNLLSGITVSFSAPGSGATGTFAGGTTSVVTNSAGIATAATLTASNTAGSYQVSASVAGVATPAVFSLTNQAGNPASIAATAGTPQSAPISTAFSVPFSAIVKDSFGNVVSGATVTFAAPGSGASGTFAGGANTALTNAAGVATSAVFTANATSGAYSVTGSVGGVATPATFSLNNTTGNPSSITPTTGTPQSVQINTAFGNTLVAVVKDIGGNVLSGITVTFTAPSTGASGTFAGGVNTAVTNASGIATSAVFTANATAGSYTVSATVSGVSTPANYSLTNLVGPAASIAVVSGSGQSTQFGTAFTNKLVAVVKDAGSNLLSGVTVTFTAPGSGASGTFAGGVNTAITDSTGTATSPVFSANNTVGSYSVTASVTGVSPSATYSLTNLTGPANSVTVVSGTPQNAAVTTTYAQPLTVVVKDGGNNPVSGVTVTFSVPGTGATATFAGGVNTAVTDATGTAVSKLLSANATAGQFTATASVAGVGTSAVFALTNVAGPAASIVLSSGSAQTVTTGLAFPLPLAALVTDANNNPVSGAVVTFTAPASSGASGTFAGGVNTAATNASGIATSVTFTANNNAGSYSVTASVPGVATTANFALTNKAGTPASIAVNAGGTQSTIDTTAFGTPLSVIVKDSNQLPLSGITVTFTLPGSGASGSFVGGVNTAVTNASGIATAPTLVANSSLGAYTVNATVSGVASPATFNLTNIIGPAVTMIAAGGDGQSALPGATFSSPLAVTVRDIGNNPIGGLAVIFSCPNSGPGCSFSGLNTATTNSAGTATSTSVVANSTAGTYSVLATTPGSAAQYSFTLTNQQVNYVGAITVTPVSVGQNLQTTGIVQLSAVAPQGGLQVTLASSDPTMFLVAGRQGDVGTTSITVGIPAGSQLTQFFIQGVAASGTATLTGSALNYQPGTTTVSLTPSGFVLAGPSGLGVSSFSTSPSSNTTLTVYAAQLDASLNYLGTQSVRAGVSPVVPLMSSNTSAGTVTPSVTFGAGVGSVTATFSAAAQGVSTLTLGAVSGFSLSNQNAAVVVTVNSLMPTIVQTDFTIGQFLQTDAQVVLNGPASSTATVTITSNDASKLLLSTSPTTPGSASITVSIGAGFTHTQSFYIQALTNTGTVTYSVATGIYGNVTGTAKLGPSGVILAGQNGVGATTLFTTTNSGNSPLTVYTAQLDNTNSFISIQTLAGGQSVSANVTSSNQAVGIITTSPVTITGGNSSAGTFFTPLTGGVTTLAVSTPQGYTTVGGLNQIAATIVAPSLSITDGDTVGKDLQEQGTVVVGQAAPSGGLVVTLTSNDPTKLKLAVNATDVGSGSITITIPAGSNNATYYLQGIVGSGSATYTASASGYSPRTATMSFAPSGVVIAGNFGLGAPFFFGSSSTGSAAFTLYTAQLDPSSLGYVQQQPLRGGVSTTVSLSSSNTAVGTFPPNAVISAGTGQKAVTLTLLSSGSTTVSIGTASGFSTPSNDVSINGNIN